MLIVFTRVVQPKEKVLVDSLKIVGVSVESKCLDGKLFQPVTFLFITGGPTLSKLYVSETVDEAARLIENSYGHTDRNEKRLDAIEQILREKVL